VTAVFSSDAVAEKVKAAVEAGSISVEIEVAVVAVLAAATSVDASEADESIPLDGGGLDGTVAGLIVVVVIFAIGIVVLLSVLWAPTNKVAVEELGAASDVRVDIATFNVSTPPRAANTWLATPPATPPPQKKGVVKGNCAKCSKPVYDSQQRNKNEAGVYFHTTPADCV
jgi:hypothetical protein